MGRDSVDLLRGTFGLLLLRAVSDHAKHGHQIIRWLREVTDDDLIVEEGAIYPALHRLESRGVLKGSWGTTEHNRQAKYYHLTAKGRRELDAERAKWERYADTVGKVLKAAT
jgi:PadR family transcriptional regulator